MIDIYTAFSLSFPQDDSLRFVTTSFLWMPGTARCLEKKNPLRAIETLLTERLLTRGIQLSHYTGLSSFPSREIFRSCIRTCAFLLDEILLRCRSFSPEELSRSYWWPRTTWLCCTKSKPASIRQNNFYPKPSMADASNSVAPTHTQQSLNNLIDLYKAWNKPEKANEWRAKLQWTDNVERTSHAVSHLCSPQWNGSWGFHTDCPEKRSQSLPHFSVRRYTRCQ